MCGQYTLDLRSSDVVDLDGAGLPVLLRAVDDFRLVSSPSVLLPLAVDSCICIAVPNTQWQPSFQDNPDKPVSHLLHPLQVRKI